MDSASQPASCDEITQPNFKSSVPAVEQASRVLFHLASSPQFKMRLTDICNRVGISKSKGHSILSTLKQFELVDQDPQTKTYSLGPGLIFLSQRVLDSLDYPDIAAPFLENLARETSGTAAFGLIGGSHIFIVAKHEGNQSLGFRLTLGHRVHFTLGAHGKAIVAFMDEAEREKLLAKKNLHFYGERTRGNLNHLRAEIAQCQTRGFAQDAGEIIPGINVVSAPVFGVGERILGILTVIGTYEGAKIQEYGPLVASAAKQISHKLGARVDAIYPV